MALIDAYKDIITALNLKVTSDGFVQNQSDEQIMVGKKSLVMPTPEQLKVNDWSNRILFHPFRENSLASSPSAVTEYIRQRFIEKLNIKTLLLIEKLTVIAADIALHKKLNPKQSEFLVAAKDVTEDYATKFYKMLDKAVSSEDVNDGPIHIFSRKNGSIGEDKFKRTAVVSFPWFSILDEGDKSKLKEIGANSFSNKDRKTLMSIMSYIFPDIEKLNAYSVGSDSGICPYMDSMMRAVGRIVERLNDVVDLFRDHIDDIEVIETPIEWYDAFENMVSYQNEIRMLSAGGDSVAVQTTEVVSQPIVQQLQQPSQVINAVQNGQPVVLTITPSQPAALVGTGPAVVAQPVQNGPVDLSSVLANNPLLHQQMLANMMVNSPQLLMQMQQQQLMAQQQAKMNRWAPGGVGAATNPIIANTGQNLFGML